MPLQIESPIDSSFPPHNHGNTYFREKFQLSTFKKPPDNMKIVRRINKTNTKKPSSTGLLSSHDKTDELSYRLHP